jgi:hypothetical protein
MPRHFCLRNVAGPAPWPQAALKETQPAGAGAAELTNAGTPASGKGIDCCATFNEKAPEWAEDIRVPPSF